MKLQFVQNAIYNGVIAHSAGSVEEVDNSNGYADRWIKRGVAIPAVDKPQPKVEPKVEPKQYGKKGKKAQEVVESEELSGKNISEVEALDNTPDFDL